MANGTIAFDTLTTSDQVKSGTEKSIDTSYLFNGVAKVWAKLSDTGVTQDSLNVSTATETSDALYTITINNDMNDTNYSLTLGTHYAELIAINSVATGSYALRTFERADSLANNDQITHSVIHGDLA